MKKKIDWEFELEEIFDVGAVELEIYTGKHTQEWIDFMRAIFKLFDKLSKN